MQIIPTEFRFAGVWQIGMVRRLFIRPQRLLMRHLRLDDPRYRKKMTMGLQFPQCEPRLEGLGGPKSELYEGYF